MDTLFADFDNSYFYNSPPLLLLEKKNRNSKQHPCQ